MPAAINLADLYRRLQREYDGENVLRAATAAVPQDAGVHHTLGLTLMRLKQLDEALSELRRAADLAPELARYAYVYAVALHSAGRGGDAMTVLKENLARRPGNRDTLLALISFSRDAGDPSATLEYAEQLAGFAGRPSHFQRIEELRQQAKKPDPAVIRANDCAALLICSLISYSSAELSSLPRFPERAGPTDAG